VEYNTNMKYPIITNNYFNLKKFIHFCLHSLSF